MYKDKFVLSVIHNGSPVRESGSKHNRQAAIPFGSEYKIRLKNKNDRSCAVRLFIDGTPVSNFGDFVVSAGGSVDLERFVTDSMNSGKRFKFVTLDHRDVDDPTSSDNGIIRAEFRLAKQPNGIWINYPDTKKDWPPRWDWPERKDYPPNFPYWDHGNSDDTNGTYWSFNYNSSTSDIKSRRVQKSSDPVTYSANFCGSMDTVSADPAASTEVGATIQGGHSGQSFGYTDLEVEEKATILQLKMVGIRRPKSSSISGSKFCTQCGHRLRKRDRYCGGCGRRI